MTFVFIRCRSLFRIFVRLLLDQVAMGTQMTKELGVYNEEEKVHTPLGPQRYRLLNNDPRSCTLGIVRTPIQVECTPTSTKIACHSGSERNSKTVDDDDILSDKVKQDIKNVKELNGDHHNSKEENSNNFKDEPSNISIESQIKYLETDIDKLVSPLNVPCEALGKKDKKTLELVDVRSPTLEIARTPILVECTPELFALHSRIDNLSFCDFDVHSEDPSAIVSDEEQTSQQNQSSINNWLVSVEDKAMSDTLSNDSFLDSPKTVAKKQKELNALKKQLFFTPDIQEIKKPKVRTPLGNLQAGQFQDSPQKLVRSKQWRNIQEERQRRGLLDSENTPPNLPPLSKVSSAPGKMVERKRCNWDEDNTMLI